MGNISNEGHFVWRTIHVLHFEDLVVQLNLWAYRFGRIIILDHNLLLSARTAMWSMPVVLTETENENDSPNQNDVAKMTCAKNDVVM